MQNAFNDSLNNIIGEGLPATAQSHLSAGLTRFWAQVSTQEIWEHKEIKKCFCPPPHFTTRTPRPQGFDAAHMLILQLLLLPPATGTAKSLPFPHVYSQETRVCSRTVNSQIHPTDGCAFPTISAEWLLLVSQPLLQQHVGNATAKWRSCKAAAVPGGKFLFTEWTGSAYTSKMWLSHPPQASLRRRQPSQAQNMPPETVESIVFHFSFTK